MAVTQHPVSLVEETSEHLLLEKPHKFEMLDGLRGIAAIAVVYFHLTGFFIDTDKHPQYLFAHGWLAVDLFFALSGFVMSHAYQKKLDGGLSTSDFLKIRLIRLYPLYIVGVLLGFFERAYLEHGGGLPFGHLGPFLLLIPALFFLPLVGRGSGPVPHNAFPYDVPTWSLFSELVANLVHGLFLRRRGSRTLAAICGASAIGLFLRIQLHGSIGFGAKSDEVLPSIVRVLFSYVAGMLLFRFWHRKARQWRVPAILPAILLICILGTPNIPHEYFFEMISVFVALPGVVLLAACSRVSSWPASLCNLVGTLSYGIYIIHQPLGALVRRASATLKWEPLSLPVGWQGVAFLALLFGLTYVLDAFYDIPVRRAVRRRLGL
jgi:peptidoglycan/LPS O-acetylase OafA/YrhL